MIEKKPAKLIQPIDCMKLRRPKYHTPTSSFFEVWVLFANGHVGSGFFGAAGFAGAAAFGGSAAGFAADAAGAEGAAPPAFAASIFARISASLASLSASPPPAAAAAAAGA